MQTCSHHRSAWSFSIFSTDPRSRAADYTRNFTVELIQLVANLEHSIYPKSELVLERHRPPEQCHSSARRCPSQSPPSNPPRGVEPSMTLNKIQHTLDQRPRPCPCVQGDCRLSLGVRRQGRQRSHSTRTPRTPWPKGRTVEQEHRVAALPRVQRNVPFRKCAL